MRLVVRALTVVAAAATALLAKIAAAFEDPMAATPPASDMFLHVDLVSGYLIARLPRVQQVKLAELLAEWNSDVAKE